MSDSTDVLQRIAPPLALLDWLDAHHTKSGTVPAEILEWAQRWKEIRGDGDSVIDGRVDEIIEKVKGRTNA